MKKVLLLLTIILFSGCSYTNVKESYLNVKQGYRDAKVVYKDAKYVLYEVRQEVAAIQDSKEDSISTAGGEIEGSNNGN